MSQSFGDVLEEKVRNTSLQIVSIGLAIFIAFVLLRVMGVNTGQILSIAGSTLTSKSGINLILEYLIPFLLTGLGFSMASSAGAFDIGLQGEFLMGMFGAALIGGYLNMPLYLHGILALLVAALFGLLWVMPAAFLNIERGANDIVLTMMLALTVPLILSYLISLPGIDDPGTVYAMTKTVHSTAEFPFLLENINLSIFHIAIVIIGIGLYCVIKRTRFGIHLRAVGKNATYASYVGIDIRKVLYIGFGLCGALAGLAGGMYLLAFTKVLYGRGMMAQFWSGAAWYGIAIGLLSKRNPLGVMLAALFFGWVNASVVQIAAQTAVPIEFGQFISGIIILIVAAPLLISAIQKRGKSLLGGRR